MISLKYTTLIGNSHLQFGQYLSTKNTCIAENTLQHDSLYYFFLKTLWQEVVSHHSNLVEFLVGPISIWKK